MVKNSGCFKKGNIPWNKGIHTGSYPGGVKTQFKKGNVPLNLKPVGSLRKNKKDGYTLIKIAEHKPWVLYQRYLYEQHYHCKLELTDCILFLDGNRENFDINNLMKVTRKENAIINHERLATKGNLELTKTGVLIAKLKIKANEKSR